jgi:hypothetical protein
MKVRLIGIAGLLVLVFALIIAPVSAATTSGYLTGNPSTYVSITLSNTSIYMPLTPTLTVSNGTLATVTCNDPFTVGISDNTNRPIVTPPEIGYMGNYTYWPTPGYGNATTTGLNTTLLNYIGVAGAANSTSAGLLTFTNPSSALSSSSTVVYTSSVANTSQPLPFTFSQLTTYNDQVLPTTGNWPSTYRIDVQFLVTAL